ncbi:hypothetical protein GCM10025867_34470 [Frondihabitans sucicola]|uniref:Uncharacterized protein n=1 Tax=Frondihabitans sucicola TaxID=1268041 RepID=A0ABN6Y1Y5_9MICO|nr:hypothetical protein GCM10025867_34470 [Frondihabitans sucicola]
MPHFEKTPYTVPVFDLMHRPGEMRESELDVAAPSKLGEGLIAVQEGAPVDIDLRIESLHDGLLVSAHVSAEATGSAAAASNPSLRVSKSISPRFSRTLLTKLSTTRFKTITWILNQWSEMQWFCRCPSNRFAGQIALVSTPKRASASKIWSTTTLVK